jgi:HKD family nuclease
MYEKLQPELKAYLARAKNVYIATALLKEYGYRFLTKSVPEACKMHYIVGIDLPSDLSVFKQAHEAPAHKVECLIYTGPETFHPKVYIIEQADGDLVAFIGSANGTAGGLMNNIEYSFKIQNQDECKAIYEWFESLRPRTSKINMAFLEKYRQAANLINKRQSSNKADAASLREILRPKTAVSPVIMGAGQFFTAGCYDAYHSNYTTDYSPAADQRRYEVRKKFKQLHDQIYPQFKAYGLNELHAHSHPYSRISHYQYRRGFNNHELKSMWLHYGYAKKECAGDNFGNHPRLQVILHHGDIGIWLVVGRDNGSNKERKRLKNRLENDIFFSELLFNTVKDIGGVYWIDLYPRNENIADLENGADLKELILSDEQPKYFIIGRTFSPDDPAISAATIADTVLAEFQRLYPVYLMLKK